jgi:hypothetical protein
MGLEASCTLHLEGRAARGKALLEQHDLIFRGPFRLAIPFKEIQSVHASDGVLAVRFGAQTAAFDLGPPAALWAGKIADPPSRADKLGIKPGLTVLLAGVADATLSTELERREARVVKRAPAGGADLIFYGVERRETLDRLERLRLAIKPDGAIWVVRPKGRRSITESDVMAAGKLAGLVDVKVVSFSDTHTAEKFVIPVAKRNQRRTAVPRPASASSKTAPKKRRT